MRDLSMEDVGVGLLLDIGMAVVTDRRDTIPMRRCVKCIVVGFVLFLCIVCVGMDGVE
jgi:hypothetical protein